MAKNKIIEADYLSLKVREVFDEAFNTLSPANLNRFVGHVRKYIRIVTEEKMSPRDWIFRDIMKDLTHHS